jgi:hypothetical protein
MGSTMSGQYEDGVRLRVSFEEPELTHIVLQGPALEAYYAWMMSGSDEDHTEFLDALTEQCADHIAQWTTIRDWDYA